MDEHDIERMLPGWQPRARRLHGSLLRGARLIREAI